MHWHVVNGMLVSKEIVNIYKKRFEEHLECVAAVKQHMILNWDFLRADPINRMTSWAHLCNEDLDGCPVEHESSIKVEVPHPIEE